MKPEPEMTPVIDEPPPFSSTLEMWEDYLAKVKLRMPEGKEKQNEIEYAWCEIARRRKGE